MMLAFGQITAILHRYGIIENPRNLRFRFTLCMQEFFDSILYVSCLKTGEKITKMEIAKSAGITGMTLRNRFKDLKTTLELN